MTSLPHAAGPMGAAQTATQVTVQNFMQEVIQASLQLPVLVYFTAPWCQPCKQFGPMLEKLVAETRGRMKLTKVDIDASPPLAQQFRIQSVPMVYVFLQGQPVDAFAGGMPEAQLRQILEGFLGASPEEEMAQATLEAASAALAEGRPDEAEAIYHMLLETDPRNIEALAGRARALTMLARLDEAEAALALVPEDKRNQEAVTGAASALAIARAAEKMAGNAGELAKRVETNPQDFDAKYDLAGLGFAQNRQEEAIQLLLSIIAKDRDWKDGAARARLLSFFEALGLSHPLSVQGRRKLSSLLFS